MWRAMVREKGEGRQRGEVKEGLHQKGFEQ